MLQRLLRRVPGDPAEAELNRRLDCYPRNHNYRIRRGALQPSPRLLRRWDLISRLYPRAMASILDVGACKGFFVLHAALQGCRRAVGIDVHSPFVGLANEVGRRLGSSAQFHLIRLEQFASELEYFGGPFHTVQVISAYHYLFWGSGLEAKGYGNHDTILGMLAKVCSAQVLFANPLEVATAPEDIQRKAARQGVCGYTTADFMDAARRHFEVDQVGFMDRKRPLLRLTKR
jgi:hypothetical protein